jgi:hypothetical protein
MQITRYILGVFLCLLSIGAFASGDTAAAIGVLVTGIALVLYNIMKKKSPTSSKGSRETKPIQPATPNKPASLSKSIKPSEEGLETATDYFGEEWQQFLSQQTQRFPTDKNFLTTFAIAYDRLSRYESGMLSLAFLSFNSTSKTEKGTLNIDFSLGMDHSKLYDQLLPLLQSKNFTADSVYQVLKQLVNEHEQQSEAREAEEADKKNKKTARNRRKQEEEDDEEEDDDIIDISHEEEQLLVEKAPPAQNQYSRFESRNNLVRKYGVKMNLSAKEAEWLGKLWNPEDAFLEMEGCCIATIRLYVDTLHEYETLLKSENKTIGQIFDPLIKIIAKAKVNQYSYKDDYMQRHITAEVESNFYFTIFRRAEIVIREVYAHKGKVSDGFYYNDYRDKFTATIGSRIDNILAGKKSSIPPPDEKTTLLLNAKTSTRWKQEFAAIARNISAANTEQVVAEIYQLGERNKKSSSLETIYFEGSKLIAGFDKLAAVKLYLYYLHADLKSQKVDGKQLNKTIQKSLFRTNEELHNFEEIISELVKDRNLKKAIRNADSIYLKKRKKIELDHDEIAEVKEQHSGTVELLSEVLDDDYEDADNKIRMKATGNEEIQITIEQKLTAINQVTEPEGPSDSLLNQQQNELLQLFEQNGFELMTGALENFARERNLFAGQLIDSINEACYEILDDVLIEENESGYTIHNDYYQKIKA